MFQLIASALKSQTSSPSELSAKLGGTPGVDGNMRYGKPGLRTHITYLGRMITGTDMKLGRDAKRRYDVLRKDLDAMRAEVDRILGPAQPR